LKYSDFLKGGVFVDKNKKLLYCILGSAILALLNNPIFERSKLAIFNRMHFGHLFIEFVAMLTDLFSLIGFALLAVFSIKLIIRNINFKDK